MRSLLPVACLAFAGACNCNPPAVVGDGGTGGGSGGGTGGGGAMAGSMSQHVVNTACPGCPAFPGTPVGTLPGFGQLGSTPACTGAGVNPQLVYPNDGALFPPNTNVVEVQFLPGTGNQFFEVDFENSITDVRVQTKCTPITNAVGTATGGCGVTLDAATWAFIADNNAGLDPLTVTVRGTPDGSCVGGSNSRTMLFAAEPVQGVIYYWQSVVFGTLQGTAGGIYRYDFGTQATAPSPFLVPSGSGGSFGNRCIGCHFISRDGKKMTFGNDDADADDEYSDLKGSLLDVAEFSASGTTKMATLSPGFQTFSPDHLTILGSDGLNKNAPAALFLYDGETGAAGATAKAPTGSRVTQPDWSADGAKVVAVTPGTVLASGNGMCTGCAMMPPMMTCPSAAPFSCTCNPATGTNNLDDNHFTGGTVVTMAASGSTFGTPAALVGGAGENDFYPAWSPDNAVVIFNRVTGDGGIEDDAFSNPRATIWATQAAGGSPTELKHMESAGVTADSAHPFASGGLTNSWPRFSPFVQTYKGKKLFWVTFSSTRDYGLRVQNQVAGEINCYPPESPENPCSGKQQLTQPNCAQPQIWMAAFTEDGLVSGDTSFPAFWLPFQSIAAHNHIAQWANALIGGSDAGITETSPDGGACVGFNATCGGASNCCEGLTCVPPSNTCQFIIQ